MECIELGAEKDAYEKNRANCAVQHREFHFVHPKLVTQESPWYRLQYVTFTGKSKRADWGVPPARPNSLRVLRSLMHSSRQETGPGEYRRGR